MLALLIAVIGIVESVRLSVTLWHNLNRSRPTIMQFSPNGSKRTGSTRREVGPVGLHLVPHFEGTGGRRRSTMVPFKRAIVVS